MLVREEWSARAAPEAARRYVQDGMVDRAPALAYYGILSLFPLLLILFSLVRLAAGSDAPAQLAEYARDGGASGEVAGALRSAAETAREASAGAAGSLGLTGLAALIYGGSRAFTASGRALDVIAHRPSTARSPGRRLQDIWWTLVALAMLCALVLVVLVSGRVLETFLDVLGLEDTLDIWTVVRWPTAAAVALAVVALVRWAAPTDRPPFRLATPGAAVSVITLLVASVGFDVYVSQIATYNTTYGASAGAIVLLLWIWLGAIAFLFGAEFDAALEDRRAPGHSMTM